jgi:hypothetical protein
MATKKSNDTVCTDRRTYEADQSELQRLRALRAAQDHAETLRLQAQSAAAVKGNDGNA